MSKNTTEKDIVKSVFITDNDTGDKYELDFSRDTVRFAEDRKFVIDEVSKFPTTKISELFWYAFRMHHKRMTQAQTDKIIEKMGGMSPELLQRLMELYMQASYSGLVADEDEAKNSSVTVEL